MGIRVTLKSNIKAVWVRAGFTMEQSPGFPRPQKRKTAVHSLTYSLVRAATQIKVHVSGGSWRQRLEKKLKGPVCNI